MVDMRREMHERQIVCRHMPRGINRDLDQILRHELNNSRELLEQIQPVV